MTQPITELVPVGSRCPECNLPVSEDHPCGDIVHFADEHGARCGVIVRSEASES